MTRCIVILAGLFSLTTLLVACAHTPSHWTPESVQPPSAEAAELPVPAPITEGVSPAPPEISPTPDAPLRVTRDGAILSGLLGNRFIEVARFGPEMEATYIDEARADFDPRLLARVSTGRARSTQPGSGLTDYSGEGDDTGGSDISSVESLLRQVQTLNQSLSALSRDDRASTTTNAGTVEVEQWLPTGTLLFLTGGRSVADGDEEETENTWSVGVTQPLLRGANMRANLAALKQARNAAAQSEHEFRRSVMEVVRDIELTYWELVLARAVVGIRQFGIHLSEEQMKREEELQAVGKAVRGDVMTAGAERAARRADLADAMADMETQTIELIHLMRPDAEPRWDLSLEPVDSADVAEVTPSASTSEDLALAFRPELAQARLSLANLDLDVLRARNERLPRLDIIGVYGEGRGSVPSPAGIGAVDTDSDSYSLGLEFETAIPNREGAARHRRAQLGKQRGESIVAQLEERIAAEVRQAIVQVTRQWERLSATAEAVLSRAEAVRVAQGRREVGKGTNLDVLQVERDFIESQVDDATARVRYIQALTNLYAAEGTLLERRGIAMEAVEQSHDPLGKPTYETK